jgi:hypothetical protein
MSLVSASAPSLLHFAEGHAGLLGGFLPLVGVHDDLHDDNGDACSRTVAGLVLYEGHVHPAVQGLDRADPGHVLVGHGRKLDGASLFGHGYTRRHVHCLPYRRNYPHMRAEQRRGHAPRIEDAKPLTTSLTGIGSPEQWTRPARNRLPFLHSPRVSEAGHSKNPATLCPCQLRISTGVERAPFVARASRGGLSHLRVAAHPFSSGQTRNPPSLRAGDCRGAFIAAAAFHSMRLVEGIPNASRARSTEAVGAARHLAGPCGWRRQAEVMG